MTRMLMAVLIVFMVVRWVQCEFFDFVDIEAPLTALWNAKESWLQHQQNDICSARLKDGSIRRGVCTKASNCLLTGGSPRSLCKGLSICCTYETTCDRTTRAKVSYFDSGDADISTSSCKYTIQLANQNVCQIRLDFDKFMLEPAKFDKEDTRKFICKDDNLDINPNYYGIPQLCGYNSGQHVYIHLNQTEGDNGDVTLKINLRRRSFEDPSSFRPAWKIKVTQLECPGYSKDIWSHHDPKTAAIDFKSLAPVAAIQYFPETSGYITSFGFDSYNRRNSFTNGESYAIAFRRRKDTCGIRLQRRYLNLLSAETEQDCTHYLHIPDLSILPSENSTSTSGKLCKGTNDTIGDIVSTHPGPLSVYFKSGNQPLADPSHADQVWAFHLKYDLLTVC